MPAIPERQPLADGFSGVISRCDDVHLLAHAPLPGAEVTASGDFIIRYALPYLGKPHLAIVPGLVALDYGEMLTGEAAWEFLIKRSNLHPRADVLGYRVDGVDDMIVVKLLDLAQPVQAYAYDSRAATQPIARIAALITAELADVAPRIRAYLPIYPSLEAWQQRE